MANRPSVIQLARAYREGKTVQVVADGYGVAFETARRWLVEAGVELRAKGRPSPSAANLPIRDLKRRYVAGESLAQLGHAFGVSPATVRSRLIEAGVELRPRPGWKY